MTMFVRVKSEHGIALIAVLTFVVVMTTLTGAFMSLALHRIKLGRLAEERLQCAYAAEAGLEQVKYRLRDSNYNAHGNVWLQNNSSSTGTVAIAGLTVGSATVDVTITGPTGEWYIATAEAVIISAGITNAHEYISMHMRDRDVFSKYMFFVHHDDIYFGTSTVWGDIHSNRSIDFLFGGAHMYGDVTCVDGIGYSSGANPDKTHFYAEVDGSVDTIGWPKTSEIATLHGVADGVYRVSNLSDYWSGLGNFNTEIYFHGDKVDIIAKNADGETLREALNQDLPPNGLIFVQKAVTSIKGDIFGKCTVATMDKVDITDNLRYIDQDGDCAYELQYEDGTPVPDYEGITDPWTVANGYYYRRNPNYDPEQPSALGIMAADDITVSRFAPYNMEWHAAVFSAEGNWHCDLSEKKGNLRVVGSMSSKYRGWRYSSSGYGWAKSGEYIYDANFINEPPDRWLKVDIPKFGGWRKGNQ